MGGNISNERQYPPNALYSIHDQLLFNNKNAVIMTLIWISRAPSHSFYFWLAARCAEIKHCINAKQLKPFEVLGNRHFVHVNLFDLIKLNRQTQIKRIKYEKCAQFRELSFWGKILKIIFIRAVIMAGIAQENDQNDHQDALSANISGNNLHYRFFLW